jgi:hypothetical protein
MSKFRPESRSYFQNAVSGYIGSGNRIAGSTKRSKPAFSKLKQLCGDHLENILKEHFGTVNHIEITDD